MGTSRLPVRPLRQATPAASPSHRRWAEPPRSTWTSRSGCEKPETPGPSSRSIRGDADRPDAHKDTKTINHEEREEREESSNSSCPSRPSMKRLVEVKIVAVLQVPAGCANYL